MQQCMGHTKKGVASTIILPPSRCKSFSIVRRARVHPELWAKAKFGLSLSLSPMRKHLHPAPTLLLLLLLPPPPTPAASSQRAHEREGGGGGLYAIPRSESSTHVMARERARARRPCKLMLLPNAERGGKPRSLSLALALAHGKQGPFRSQGDEKKEKKEAHPPFKV